MVGGNSDAEETKDVQVDHMEIDGLSLSSSSVWKDFFEKNVTLKSTKFVDLLRENYADQMKTADFPKLDDLKQAKTITDMLKGDFPELTEDQVESALETLKAEEQPATWEEFFEKYEMLKGADFVDLLRTNWNSLMNNADFAAYDLPQQGSILKPWMQIEIQNVTEEQVKAGILIFKSSMNQSGPAGRGANITDGLEIELVHKYDLTAFERRVNNLFDWHDEACSKFVAPYFPFVQSSGMGKTKILTAYREACKTNSATRICLTILCAKKNLLSPERYKMYYDDTLFIPVFYPSDEECRVDVWKKLDTMLKEKSESKDEVVLMFDEAQGLMGGDKSKNMVFRASRWWLRRADRGNQKVVAVFAGTTARLTNFFPPDPPPSRFSRDSTTAYRNYSERQPEKEAKLRLYEPFYELNTISCLRKDGRVVAQEKRRSACDVERAAIYGRPLFAHYALEGSLTKEKLADFAKRLVLSSINYETYLPACLSVLGSRVQMGAVDSFDTLSELVSSGYACLVDFQGRARYAGGLEESNATPQPTAHLTFMPDPVIAWLAMCYMDKGHSLAATLTGNSKQFWVEKAALAFRTKLCRPAKGDVGEVFAALYMLMCGDELRKEIDSSLRSFGVLINDWFNLLKNGGKLGDEHADTTASKKAKLEVEEGTITRSRKGRASLKQKASDANASRTMTVSFIQICRSEMRANSFCEPSKLEHLYRAGLGCYAYNNCKGINIVASIRISGAAKAAAHGSAGKNEAMIMGEEKDEEEKFHPLFVSVKNWATVSLSDVFGWEESMKSFLGTLRGDHLNMDGTVRDKSHSTAVCIILLVGCSNPPSVSSETDLGSPDLLPFPEEDVFRFISIPEKDAFGISEALLGLASASVRSEMYLSHGFVPGESTPQDFLRSNASAEDKIEVSAWFETMKLSSAAGTK